MATNLSSGRSSTGQDFTLNPAFIISSRPTADILEMLHNKQPQCSYKSYIWDKTQIQKLPHNAVKDTVQST